MGTLALLEVLDRDGQVRQSYPVLQWPLHIGRALDNDVVLSDPHVAPRHLSIAPDEHADLAVSVAQDTRNGVLLGRTRLRARQGAVLAPDGEPIELGVGRTRLRLRLPGHLLDAEVPLATSPAGAQRTLGVAAGAVLLAFGLLFVTYLNTDPDGYARAAGSTLLSAIAGAAIWCGAWALLSKTFTRQAHFGWHLRVFLCASLALLVTNTLPALLAFAFSWPWLTDFSFVADIAVGATALYFHLLAVEPARHRVLKWAAATCALVGVALTLWFNVQRSDLFGTELYMNHLFPPGWRLARPVSTDSFIDSLTPLKAALDAKAKEPGRGGDGGSEDD